MRSPSRSTSSARSSVSTSTASVGPLRIVAVVGENCPPTVTSTIGLTTTSRSIAAGAGDIKGPPRAGTGTESLQGSASRRPTRSSAREPGLATLDERLEPFAAVLGLEERGHVGVEPRERRFLTLEAGAVRRGERRLDAKRRRPDRDRLGELDRPVELAAGLDDLLD